MRIDIFSHIIPREFLRRLAKYTLPEALFWVESVDPQTRFNFFCEAEPRIKYMSKYGIDIQVLSLGDTGLGSITNDSAVELARIANDSISEIVQRYPDHFTGIATVPLTNVMESVSELKRSNSELGLRGVQIYSNRAGQPLDSPELDPFYALATKLDIPIFIHPTSWKHYEWVNKFQLEQIFGWPFDTTLAVARLIFAGVLERYPKLKVVLHHSGGMIPYFPERIKGFYDQSIEYLGIKPAPSLSKHIIDYFKLLYADTAVQGWKPLLECAYAFFGADHLVFGTDYPYGPELGERHTRNVIQALHSLKLSEEEESKIFEMNTRTLLKM